MSSYPSPAPVAVADGQTITFPLPQGQVAIVRAEVLNLSAMALLVSDGARAGTWVQPGGTVGLAVTSQPVKALAAAVQGGPTTGTAVCTYFDASGADYQTKPGQLAVVNSTGTVTISGGSVSVSSGTIGLQTQTEVGHFTVTAGNSAGPLNFAVPATTVGIGIFLEWQGINARVQSTDFVSVFGHVSGVALIYIGGNPPAASGIPAMTQSYYQGILDPGIDTSVDLQYQNHGAHDVNVRVVAYSQLPFVQNTQPAQFAVASGIPQPAAPIITAEWGGSPIGEFSSNVSSGASNVAILPAPTAGFVWEVRRMHVHANTAIANTTSIVLHSITGGSIYLLAYSGAAGTVADSDARFLLNDGLQANNSTAQLGSGLVLARQVPAIP